MKPNEFLKMFIEDCRYYDLEKREIKTILKNIDLKGKTILDVGAGIGRLSLPLSKYAEEVVALDKDKRFKVYFKKHKKKNVKFVNQSLERYSEINKKFDIILIVWPTFDLKFIKLIKRLCFNKTKIIFISCYNDSDFETMPDKLGLKSTKENILKKKRFIKELIKNFKPIIKKQINTEYLYPNEKIAFKVIKNCLNVWYDIKLKNKDKENLIELIKKHKKGKKVIFGEKIYFYIMKLKCKS